MNVIKRIGLRMVKKRKKVAIFVDWENVRKEIKNIQDNKNKEKISFNFNDVDNVEMLIRKAVREGNEQIDKIYFYTAEPLSYVDELERDNAPELKAAIQTYINDNKSKCEDMEKLIPKFRTIIDNFRNKKDFEVRLGKVKLKATESGELYSEQKQVDMYIGMDIAELVHKWQVKKIIIFSKDTDMIPAIEYAKRNKIEVILVHIVEGYKIPNEFENAKYKIIKISLAKEFPRMAR